MGEIFIQHSYIQHSLIFANEEFTKSSLYVYIKPYLHGWSIDTLSYRCGSAVGGYNRLEGLDGSAVHTGPRSLLS